MPQFMTGVQHQLHRAAIPPCIGDTKHVQCELIHCLLRKSMCSMAVTYRTGAFYHCVSLPHNLNFVRTVVSCFTLISPRRDLS